MTIVTVTESGDTSTQESMKVLWQVTRRTTRHSSTHGTEISPHHLVSRQKSIEHRGLWLIGSIILYAYNVLLKFALLFVTFS